MRERPRLDAVLFDAGGTLVRLDFEWMSQWLARQGVSVPVERLRRGEIEGRRRVDEALARPPANPGSGSASPARSGAESAGLPASRDAAPDPPGIREYYSGMLAAAGVPAGGIEPALAAFRRRHAEIGLWSRPQEGARAAIDGVAALGLRRAVVSNSDGRAELHLSESGMREGLEFVVDSHHVGVEKPDPAILAMALERLGVGAARALYVGDLRSVDAAVARNAGCHFVLVDPYGDYGAGLETIGSLDELPAHITRRFATPVIPVPDRGALPGPDVGKERSQ